MNKEDMSYTAVVLSNKPEIKTGLLSMINEYNNLTDIKDKNRYMDSVIEWYMREKTLLNMTKSGDTKDNKYNSDVPYSGKL